MARKTLGDVSALRCDGSKIYVSREPLDSGGYTRSGRYFGVGEKLWSFSNDSSAGYIRAASMAAAKKALYKKCAAPLSGARRRKKRRR